METWESVITLCFNTFTEEVDYIQNETTTKSREAAVDTFIQKLEKNKHQPGTFTAVVQALENSSNYACFFFFCIIGLRPYVFSLPVV